MAATYTPVLGTSNVRGSSRQTRTNPARTSKTNGSNLRQNSLISIQPSSVHGGPEPHGFYPAIQHFTDAISAFPREYRRHTSLLKEVDAKAWQPEENLQILLSKCLADQPTSPPPPVLPSSAAPSITHPADDAAQASAANSVAGLAADVASQISSASSTSLQRRQLFGALRHNLFQIMVTMDEKNHVINNANEELSTHIRRLDNVWPHLADEISEEARLGSLRHWALTDMNPTKKSAGSTSRLDTNMAIMPSNELARRSESRREAVAAKTKQRLNRLAQLDSGTEVKNPKKKALAREDRANDSASDVAGLGISTAKGKKGAKTGGAAMEKSLSAALGGRAMSREPSQQDGSKKRKAPASGAAVARKRINAAADSPKLASSPLASSFPKDAYKRSPALAAARPVSARARPNSSQVETSRTKSSAAQRSATSTGTAGRTAAGSSKTATEDKTYPAAQGDQQGLDALEAQHHQTQRADGPVSKGIARTQQLAERRASKTRDADTASARGANSPRLATLDTERGSRGRASKTSTPIVGTFSEAEFANAVSANGDTTSGAGNSKAKRPARPRPKYDGLHDSLSPKGLPPKRLHKKNGSVATLPGSQGSSAPARLKEEASMDGRLQRSNSGNTAMSGSGNATPNDMEGSDDDDVNDGQRQSSQPRGSRGRGRSQQNSRKGTNGGSRDTARGRAADADPGAEDGDVDVDGEAELGPAAQPVTSRRNTMPDPDVDMNDGDAEVDADPDADADADAEQEAEDADHDPDADADPDPDDTAELDPDATDPANDNDNDAGVDADADADAGDDDEDDIRYCYCQMRSYGAMVACDNDDCPIQWFHLGCSGLKSLPRDNAEWYCKECREQFVGAAA